MLVDGGASAYFFERPEENRVYPIPSGGENDHSRVRDGHARLPLAAREHHLRPGRGVRRRGPAAGRGRHRQARPGDEPRAGRRAPAAGRVRADAAGGRRHAACGARARRCSRASAGAPRAATAGGRRSAAATRSRRARTPTPRSPPQPCAGPACSTRITPEYEFSSSAPDIGDFVAQDPASTNLRKPLIGADDKVVTDGRSGLFCPFNAGKTTITVKAGGLAYSTEVTVQAGSVQRPCGTRPLNPDRFTRAPARRRRPRRPRRRRRPRRHPRRSSRRRRRRSTSPSRASVSARARRPAPSFPEAPPPPLDEPVPAQRQTARGLGARDPAAARGRVRAPDPARRRGDPRLRGEARGGGRAGAVQRRRRLPRRRPRAGRRLPLRPGRARRLRRRDAAARPAPARARDRRRRPSTSPSTLPYRSRRP